jgi:hypothetical protein
VIGFSALTTNSSGSHRLEICDYAGVSFWLTIDVANPDGSSSGNLLSYEDGIGGGCQIATKGYPMRKFRALWDGAVSDWNGPAR